MPYEIKPFGKGYRVFMPDNPEFYFSYHPMTKAEAIQQKHALELQGEGLFDYIKNIFNPNSSPNFENAINKFGDYTIAGLRIVREPIQSILKSVLNVVSAGKFNKYKNKYDDIFHLSLLLDLVNPKDKFNYYKKTEKRPNIHFEGISKYNYFRDYKESYNIQPIRAIKLKDVLALAKKNMGSFLYSYEPVVNNCQTYIYNIINAYFQLLNQQMPQDIKIFILQDVEDIVTGTARNVARKVTSLGHLFGRIMGNGDCCIGQGIFGHERTETVQGAVSRGLRIGKNLLSGNFVAGLTDLADAFIDIFDRPDYARMARERRMAEIDEWKRVFREVNKIYLQEQDRRNKIIIDLLAKWKAERDRNKKNEIAKQIDEVRSEDMMIGDIGFPNGTNTTARVMIYEGKPYSVGPTGWNWGREDWDIAGKMLNPNLEKFLIEKSTDPKSHDITKKTTEAEL